MYCHDILALDAIIHSTSLYFLSFSQTHTNTVCVCEYPLLKSYNCFVLFFLCEGMWGLTAQSVSYRGMYEMYAFTFFLTWSLHFPFTSDHVRPPFVCLIILTFTASLRDVGDQDIHHSIWHSHSTRLHVIGWGFTRYWKGNDIAIIKCTCIRASSAVGTQS